jgi:hypothetical protein
MLNNCQLDTIILLRNIIGIEEYEKENRLNILLEKSFDNYKEQFLADNLEKVIRYIINDNKIVITFEVAGEIRG